MNNLATLYLNQGRYDEAEPLYLETLESRKRYSVRKMSDQTSEIWLSRP